MTKLFCFLPTLIKGNLFLLSYEDCRLSLKWPEFCSQHCPQKTNRSHPFLFPHREATGTRRFRDTGESAADLPLCCPEQRKQQRGHGLGNSEPGCSHWGQPSAVRTGKDVWKLPGAHTTAFYSWRHCGPRKDGA